MAAVYGLQQWRDSPFLFSPRGVVRRRRSQLFTARARLPQHVTGLIPASAIGSKRMHYRMFFLPPLFKTNVYRRRAPRRATTPGKTGNKRVDSRTPADTDPATDPVRRPPASEARPESSANPL